MDLQPIQSEIFEADWRRLQERFHAKDGEVWADGELEESRLGDESFRPGHGDWAGFALDLPSGRTRATNFGSTQHKRAFLELVSDVEDLLVDGGNAYEEAHLRVAEFRLAKIPGYETPWAARFNASLGRNQKTEDLRDWFLRERIALPLFFLYRERVPRKVRAAAGQK